MNDTVTARVAQQYADFCYPEPLTDLAAVAHVIDGGDPSAYADLFWPEGRPRAALRILIAGCGTNQAARMAYANPECEVIGVDLSQASIDHGNFLKAKHHLSRLRLERLDLRNVASLGMEFNLIVSTGVLHHMSDPIEGLRALGTVLEPSHGAMYLMLYSRAARRGVYEMQDVFRRLNVPQNKEGVAFVRTFLDSLPSDHPVRWYMARAPELQYDAALVDTFLHSQDVCYSLAEVMQLVSNAGLSFNGWGDNANFYPDALLAKWPDLRKTVSGMPVYDQWCVTESVSANSGNYHFLACKPERAAHAVDFAGEAWLGYRPVRHPALGMLKPASVGIGEDGLFQRGDHTFPLSPAQSLLLGLTDGSATIEQIISVGELRSHSLIERIEFARMFFGRMWRSGHMFFKI